MSRLRRGTTFELVPWRELDDAEPLMGCTVIGRAVVRDQHGNYIGEGLVLSRQPAGVWHRLAVYWEKDHDHPSPAPEGIGWFTVVRRRP